jgi:GNAT superfamily N-acetyltransferase
VPILRQLWTDRDPEAVLEWTREGDYRLFGRFAADALVAVAGVQVQSLLHYRRGAWLLDSVVDEPHRGDGHGAAMMDFVESRAAERDCENVALASPLEKGAVHEFYPEQDYEQWGYAVETDIESTGARSP